MKSKGYWLGACRSTSVNNNTEVKESICVNGVDEQISTVESAMRMVPPEMNALDF